MADRIDAALWFSDLRGYTKITDTAPPDEVIPLLNDYAEAVITAIQQAGGEPWSEVLATGLVHPHVLALVGGSQRAQDQPRRGSLRPGR